ncbi:hypothetical protein HYV83_04060 [Candidatus Woesearchaeota archaeon]|nr:hypothetical protein [Candidatus Woesearchaeota archaeon]
MPPEVDWLIKEAVKDIAENTFPTVGHGKVPYLTSEYELQAQLFARLFGKGFAVKVEYSTNGKYVDVVLFENGKGRCTLTVSGTPDRFFVDEFIALIELKLFWNQMSKDDVLNALQKDKIKLLHLTVPKRYVIGFDYLGKLGEEDVRNLKGNDNVTLLYVNIKNKELHFL